jgi:tetratricopeptide (TPR) repeat protein
MTRSLKRAPFLAGLIVLVVGLPASLCQQSARNSLQEGIRALNAGDFVSAEHIFSELHKHGASAENSSYLALAEAGGGDLVHAIAHFQESIRLGNDQAAVHYDLGIAYLNFGRDEDGIRELRTSLERDPKPLPPQRALGIALVNVGRPQQAVPYLEQASRLSPHDPEIWVNLARAQFDLRNDNAALQIADEALEAIPSNTRMDVALADLCLEHDQLQKARSILKGATESTSDDPNVALPLARVRLRAGEAKEALAALERVPADAGSPGETMFLRGEAWALTGNYVVADVDLSAAIKADSRNPTYLVLYAWLQQLEGRHKEALATLDKADELEVHIPETSFRRAVSYYYLHLDEQVVQACNEAIHLEPHDIPAYLLLGVARYRLHDLGGAQEAFAQAVSLKPTVAYFHLALAIVLYKEESLAASRKELDQALVLDPQAAQAHFYRARLLAEQGDRREAIEDLETAVALRPHYREAYAELARLYYADGQSEKAKAALAKQSAELRNEENEDRRMLQQMRDSTDELSDILKFSDILESR